MAYDKLPQYGSNAGAPDDVWDAELERWLTTEELDRLSPQERRQGAWREVAQKRRAQEYVRREQEKNIQRNGGGARDNNPMRGIIQAKADLLENPEKSKMYMSALWYSHAGGFVISAALALAMFIHFGVWHWSQHHKAGRFPLESNFLHGVPPVNDDRDIDNVPFFWPLIFIPILCMVFHGMLIRSKAFAVYFYDNILHHMGSAKYLAYSGAYALFHFVALVLMGVTDIFLLLTVAMYGAAMYMSLHSADWQHGKRVKSFFSNLYAGEKLVIDSMVLAVGEPAMRAGSEADGLIEDVSESVKNAIDGGASIANSTVDVSADTARVLAKLSAESVRLMLRSVMAVLTPTDIVMTTYLHATLMQIWLYIIVLVYYISANVNSGWDNLPWIAHFAFFMFFVPGIVQFIAYMLYFFEVGEFVIYAAHELLLITAHTPFLCVFTGVVYFFSAQFGTIYV